jgi:hypothetical protein
MSKFLRVVGILFSLVLMVGFGLCGALGLYLGRESAFVLLCGIAGIAIALVSGLALRKLLRARARPEPEQPD